MVKQTAPTSAKLEKVIATHVETGEEMTLFAKRKKRLPHPYASWLAVDQARLAEIASNRSLSPLAVRLVLLLMAEAISGNTLYVCQKDCAERLGYCRQQISPAWKELRKAGLIEEGAQYQGRATWVLAPDVAWKGPVDKLITIIRTRMMVMKRRLDDSTKV